ncbi:MAG: aminotransferase class I/II-fold pyridoxal phosphate-dependent enzyme, partial [Nitrosopumilus sp.]
LDNTNTIQRRLEVLIKKANEMNLDFIVPDGAMYLFARVNQEGFDGVKFATALLDQGLAVAPGEGFGDYKKFIRLSACQEERVLSDGMNILSGFLRDKQ